MNVYTELFLAGGNLYEGAIVTWVEDGTQRELTGIVSAKLLGPSYPADVYVVTHPSTHGVWHLMREAIETVDYLPDELTRESLEEWLDA